MRRESDGRGGAWGTGGVGEEIGEKIGQEIGEEIGKKRGWPWYRISQMDVKDGG